MCNRWNYYATMMIEGEPETLDERKNKPESLDAVSD